MPVASAMTKLPNSSFMISASPVERSRTPAGRLRMIGSSEASRVASPSGSPFSSASTVALRTRSSRSTWAGPAPWRISATVSSGTASPPRPSMRSARSVSSSARAGWSSITRIWICRSGRLKRARFWSTSPVVAIRAVEAIAADETPSSAARASRGTICSSGRAREAVERAPASCGMPRICRSRSRTAPSSATGSSETSVTASLAPLWPSAPKRKRAPGIRSSCGRSAASTCCWLSVRSARGTSVTIMLASRGSPSRVVLPSAGPPPPPELRVPSEAKTEATSGRAFMMRVASCTAASVSASDAPGASSIASEARPRSAAGTKSCGISGTIATDATKKAVAPASVTQRCRMHQPSRPR
jgi:hypothetical protein